jgi:hypothetical protein
VPQGHGIATTGAARAADRCIRGREPGAESRIDPGPARLKCRKGCSVELQTIGEKRMSKKLIAGCVFLFGMGLGVTAFAGSANITEEMAACLAECKLTNTHAYCWACCVQKQCPVID